MPAASGSARIFLLTTALWLGLAAISTAAVVYSGLIDPAADEPHSRPVYWLLESLRQHGVASRAGQVQVPSSLANPTLIVSGAGNYEAMCAGCHLRPGGADSEMYRGLYPRPPALARTARPIPPAEAFWVITHGIKASGMPAWGQTMDEQSIWGLVAFLQKLPQLTPESYKEAVERSPGHRHGGGNDNNGAAEPPWPAAVSPGPASEENELQKHNHSH